MDKHHNIPDVIILAGGLGTRLKSTISDLPKCMAPVANKPFLDHILSYYVDSGCHRFIFALGFLHDIVIDHLNTAWPTLNYDFSIEDEPLGTGGAVSLAFTKVTSEHFLILNGDTLFNISIDKLIEFHYQTKAFITLSLKYMTDFERYGTVILNPENQITGFEEKKACLEGLINGGVYIVNTAAFKALNFPDKYSFETDFLQAYVGDVAMYGMTFNTYFIDIGVPEDFHQANIDLI